MRIFLICLLAVGGITAELTKKITQNKHVKRGVLTGDDIANFYGAHQYDEHVKTGYQHGHQSGPVSSYTSDQSYTSGSLPIGNHQIYSTGAHENVQEQSSIHQIAGQGYDQSVGFQEEYLGQGNYGYDNPVSTQPIVTRVESHLVKFPVPVPHPVPIDRPIQVPIPHPVHVEVPRPVEIPVPSPVPVYVTKTYPVNIDRPVPVPQPYAVPHPIPVPVGIPHPVPVQVSHQETLNVGSQQEYVHGNGATFGQGSFQEFGSTFNGKTADIGDVEHFNSDSRLGGYEQINTGSQQYNFGGQPTYTDVTPLENAFDDSFKTGNYQQHILEPVQVTSDVSESHNSGYHYDKPTKKFTF